MNEFYVALGSNLSSSAGSPSKTLGAAIEALDSATIHVSAVSPLYQTPCFPAGAGPDYVNAVARLCSELAPSELLTQLHAVEIAFGRERKERWGTRTLDLDILACDHQILPDLPTFQQWASLDPSEQTSHTPQELILPHPRLHERAFVLVPFCDVAPDWRHPVLNLTVKEMRDALPPKDVAEVVPV